MALDSSENEKVFAELERKAAEDEAMQEAERQALAKKFDIKALAASTGKRLSCVVVPIGTVEYMLLTSGEVDALEFPEKASVQKRAEIIVFAMLAKADSSILMKDFDALPYDVKNLLVSKLIGSLPSFLAAAPSTGSALTLKLKTRDLSHTNTATP